MGLESKKYIKYQFQLFLTNIVVFLIGMLLFILDFGVYSEVLVNETKSWSKGAVINVTPVDQQQSCPVDSEQESAIFLGTETICKKIYSNYYSNGKCTKSQKSTGRTITGLDEAQFYIFSGKKLCVTRSTSLNFHNITQNKLDSFGSCGSASSVCGPTDYQKGFSYCSMSDKQCAWNNLTFQKSNNASLPPNFSSKQYNGNWTIYYSTSEDIEPIADIYIGLSPPCGDTSQNFNIRSAEKQIYKTGECSFEMNDQQLHPEYRETGYSEPEKSVLIANNYFTLITEHVPDYSDYDFKGNYYRIYSKPYPYWTKNCQLEYSTEEVQQHAKNIDNITSSTKAVFIVSIIQMVQFAVIWLILKGYDQNQQRSHIENVSIASMILSFILYVLIFIFFANAFFGVSSIKKEQIKFYIDEQCSNELMVYSFQQVYDALSSMFILSLTGFLLTLVMLLLDLFASLDSFHIFHKCFKKKEENHVEESLLPDQEEKKE